MAYSFESIEDKKHHYKLVHKEACTVYNLKNKARARELYLLKHKKSGTESIYKQELIRFVLCKNLFC